MVIRVAELPATTRLIERMNAPTALPNVARPTSPLPIRLTSRQAPGISLASGILKGGAWRVACLVWTTLLILILCMPSDASQPDGGDDSRSTPATAQPQADAAPRSDSQPLDHAALVALIDANLAARWQAGAISEAPVCSDETFVRRVYLDVVGRIPDDGERQRFLADGRADKRAALIDVLLASEDHVQHMTDMFDTLLMGRGDGRRYRQRTEHHWRSWLERVFRDNRPWDEAAAEMLLARPKSTKDAGAVWFLYERENNHQAIAEAIAPAFFGIKIDCAQCHDHMIASEIEQQHYWGLVAFFNRSKNENTKLGPRVAESAIGGFSDFANIVGESSPNRLTFYNSATVEEPRPDKDAKEEDRDELYLASSIQGEPRVPKFSRRERFVEEIFRDHPLVARAFVNRVWAMMLGRGIVHPFDQMDSFHDASHPELLDALADDFRKSRYDIRRLLRAVLNSKAYHLQSRRLEGIEDPSLFAWFIERPLTAEQLARSIQVGLRGRFDNQHPLVSQLRTPVPSVMPETIVTGVSEPLFLSNNPALNRFIAESQSSQDLLGKLADSNSPQDAAAALVIALLGREADAEEAENLVRFLADPSVDQQKSLSSNRLQYAAWALITSAEFRFNH